MKKFFTLVSMALFAMSMDAQDVYNAIVDGKLASEFAAVAGENGGVANNSADGKSIVTITKGNATVTAVGGTTPANEGNIDGGAQQIVPDADAVIDADKHIYEVASVGAWNPITWGKDSKGDIDFWYVTGTGNPYVKMNAVENSKDDEWQGNYKADYVYYEPDGSVGMPITGLYYKFTASAAGAFKVKVWANKGNRKTFVVNAKTMKAERLLASGYINGVNDAYGKKKLLTIEQVDSVHHVYIYGDYETAVAKGKADDETQEDFETRIANLKATADANSIARQYVIGNGNQNFWGWLTFDVEAGEEYWVFQHSSQIGFGGFEFHEGKTADELINGIEAAYVYTTNFSTYEDEETGEFVTWKGEKAVGAGKFTTTEEVGAIFGDYFLSAADNGSYCVLPTDVLAHSAKTEGMTLAVWVKADDAANATNYQASNIFSANAGVLACPVNGTLALTDATYNDATNAASANKTDATWLSDGKWHYYTAVFNKDVAQVYVDGTIVNEWSGVSQNALLANGANLTDVRIGQNTPFSYARLLIKNSPMTAGEIKAQMQADFGDINVDEYLAGGNDTNKGDVNGDGSITMADANAVVNYFLATDKPENFDVESADVNGDGSITMADANQIVNMFLGGTK